MHGGLFHRRMAISVENWCDTNHIVRAACAQVRARHSHDSNFRLYSRFTDHGKTRCMIRAQWSKTASIDNGIDQRRSNYGVELRANLYGHDMYSRRFCTSTILDDKLYGSQTVSTPF